MSRRVVAAGVVFVVALVVGVLLAPLLFDGRSGTEAGRQTAEVTPSEPVTLSTSSPEAPTTEPATASPEEQADLLAGVRSHLVPPSSTGELRVVPGATEPPEGSAEVMTVRVEVEEGLDIDDEAFAAFVITTLNDPRGWGADGSVRFARTDGEADIRVVLATAATVDEMCAPLATNGRWSCGRYGHAALNADRWVFGADAWAEGGGTLTDYRQYLVNHEVGHLLGHPHEQCPVSGEPAPVMVQQSIDLDGCAPNGWPHP
jgi:hypothetical protein